MAVVIHGKTDNITCVQLERIKETLLPRAGICSGKGLLTTSFARSPNGVIIPERVNPLQKGSHLNDVYTERVVPKCRHSKGGLPVISAINLAKMKTGEGQKSRNFCRRHLSMDPKGKRASITITRGGGDVDRLSRVSLRESGGQKIPNCPVENKSKHCKERATRKPQNALPGVVCKRINRIASGYLNGRGFLEGSPRY